MTLDPRVGFWLGMLAAVLVFSSTGTGADELKVLFGDAAATKIVSACSYLGGMLTLIVGLLHGVPSGSSPADAQKFAFGPAAKSVADQANKIMPVLFMVVALSGLAACSDSTLDKITGTLDTYNHSVDNFDAAAAAFDTSIAKTSASLAKYCTDAIVAGNNLKPLAQTSQTARTGLATAATGLQTWCSAPPTNVGTAISAMSAVVANAVQAYKTAKAGG